MSISVREFVGNALYLDTMVFYGLLRGLDFSARTLFSQIQSGRITAYTSVLTFDELAYRMILALIRDNYGGSPLERLRQQEEKMIDEFFPRLAPPLAKLRTFPNLVLLNVTASDLPSMDDFIVRYHLRPRDALHLVAIHKCNCFDIVSHDTHFDHVPTICRYILAS